MVLQMEIKGFSTACVSQSLTLTTCFTAKSQTISGYTMMMPRAASIILGYVFLELAEHFHVKSNPCG